MKKKLTKLLSKIKIDYREDKLGFVVLAFAYLSIAASVISIPLFTYREDFNFITNALCVAASAFSILYVFLRGKFYINYFVMFILLFLAYATIITLFTTKQLGFNRLVSIFTLYGYVLCLIQFWFNKNSSRLFIITVCVGTILFTGLFVYTYRDSIIAMDFEERFGYDFGNVNTICFIFVLGIMFLVYVALKVKKWAFLLLVPAGIMAFCALITGSRWGLISLIVGLIILIYQLIGKRYKIEFFISAIAIVLVFVGLLQLPAFAAYKKHFLIIFDFLAGKSTGSGSHAVRTAMFMDGIKLWIRNIFLGYGCDGFLANTSYGMYSHSSIIELLTNYGLIGFTLFFFPVIKLLINTKYNKNNTFASFSKSLIILFLVYCFFAVWFMSKFGILCLGILVGSDFTLNKNRQIYFQFSFFESKKFSFTHKLNVPIKENKQIVVPQKLKIAFVISALHGGGAERVASILANTWVEQGHDVTFFITSNRSNKSYNLDARIGIVNVANASKIKFIPSLKINKLCDSIELYNPNAIISFLSTPNYYASVAAKRLKIPFVCSERSDPSKTKSLLVRALRYLTFRRADYIVFQGEQAQNHFSKSIKKKSGIIINPCTVPEFKVKKQGKTVISAGRLEKLKGFDVLIRAFSEVLKKFPDYSLKIFGDGSEKEALANEIKELKIENNVSLNPFSDSLFQEMKSSKLYVLSSRYEGMPNTMCEALLLGVPVVSTDCPIGLSSTLIENKCNGLICKTDNFEDMANSIICVLDNIDSYMKNSVNKVNYYKDLLNPNAIGGQWIGLFKKVVENYE